MSGILDEHPDIRAVDARLTQARVTEMDYLRLVGERAEEYRSALALHAADAQAALAAGNTPPPRPEPAISDEDHQRQVNAFQNEQTALREERTRILAAARAWVEHEARTRYADTLTEARRHVEALHDIAARVRDLQHAVSEVAAAQNAIDAADPMKGRIMSESPTPADPQALLSAVEHGTDLLIVSVPRHLGWTGSR